MTAPIKTCDYCGATGEMPTFMECDAMRTMIQVALEVLDNVHGNINPERGYADELEVDIEHAITTITSLA